MIYRSRFFDVRELVDPGTFSKLGDRSWIVFRPEALRMLDDVREFLGVPCVVNDWYKGGGFKYSGFRPPSCTVGAPLSAHRLGCAFDIKPKSMTIKAAWAKIQGAATDPRLSRVRRAEAIEDTPTWLHLDVYEHDGAGILVVKP